MKVTLKTDIRKVNEEFKRRIHKITLSEIEAVGLQIITDAREKQGHDVGGFNDITGHLRSSIGYIVLYNGKQIVSNFTGEQIGVDTGKTVASNVAKDYPKGYVLIMVAGMNYATYVEDRGYDVLSGSAMLAGKLMREVENNVKRAFND